MRFQIQRLLSCTVMIWIVVIVHALPVLSGEYLVESTLTAYFDFGGLEPLGGYE